MQIPLPVFTTCQDMSEPARPEGKGVAIQQPEEAVPNIKKSPGRPRQKAKAPDAYSTATEVRLQAEAAKVDVQRASRPTRRQRRPLSTRHKYETSSPMQPS